MTKKELEAAIEQRRRDAYLRFCAVSSKKHLYEQDHSRRLAEAEKLANS